MKFDGKLEGEEYQPRPARIDVCYAALMRLDWGTIEATILNVSDRGFRLRADTDLEPGDVVTLEVPRLEPVRASIRWARGNEAGGLFLDPVAL